MPARPRPIRSTAHVLLGLVALGLVLQACGESVTQVGPEDVVTLRVTPDSSLLATGRTLQMRAYPLDETSAILSGIEITWTTSNSAVATIDDSGLATGVAVGEVEFMASAAGFATSALVTVVPPPTIVFSDDTVAFAAQAGGAEPAVDSVAVTNGGTFALQGLAVDSILYSAGADAWLTPTLLATVAPTTLTLAPTVAGLTTAGAYTATAWLSGIDAFPKAIVAELTVAPGAATTAAVQEGDQQTAAVGTAVPIAPAVLVSDDFGNPVPAIQVTFAVTSGGGAVTDATVATDSLGVARVGSWTLGTAAGVNQVTATPAGLSAVVFTATAVPAAAAALEINAGDNQSAVASAELSVAPSVIVRDAFGNGVPGVAVTFALETGGGVIQGAAQTTDASGVATVGSWTLGTVSGVNTLSVTAAGVAGTVSITANGISGDAFAIQLEAGNTQTDTVGATLPTPYAVRVVDINGNGVAGVTVSWAPTGGGGSTPSTSVTDATGVATAERTLSTTVGTHLAEGGVGGLQGSPVVFTATATVGAPFSVTEVEGGGQSTTAGTSVSIDPRVVVEDQFGNAIAGHPVTFTPAGGGSVAPTGSVPTNASGEASLTSWTLGTVAGTNNNTVQALAGGAGLVGNPVTFTASATPDAPASIVVAAGNGQTAVTGLNVANQPTVTVTDQYGNPVPSVTVDFVASGSGSVGTPSMATSGSGQAMTSWAVDVGGSSLEDDGTFANTLTATVSGAGLSTQFAGSARYSYPTHVNPLWSSEGCLNCHVGSIPSGSIRLDLAASTNRAALYNVVSTCNGSFRRVSPISGPTADDLSTLILLAGFGESSPAPCGNHGSDLSDPGTAIVRAWIQNGAPSN